MPSDCTSPAHCCLLLPAAAICCRAAANWGRVPALHSAPVQLSVIGAALAPTVLTAHDEAASGAALLAIHVAAVAAAPAAATATAPAAAPVLSHS